MIMRGRAPRSRRARPSIPSPASAPMRRREPAPWRRPPKRRSRLRAGSTAAATMERSRYPPRRQPLSSRQRLWSCSPRRAGGSERDAAAGPAVGGHSRARRHAAALPPRPGSGATKPARRGPASRPAGYFSSGFAPPLPRPHPWPLPGFSKNASASTAAACSARSSSRREMTSSPRAMRSASSLLRATLMVTVTSISGCSAIGTL